MVSLQKKYQLIADNDQKKSVPSIRRFLHQRGNRCRLRPLNLVLINCIYSCKGSFRHFDGAIENIEPFLTVLKEMINALTSQISFVIINSFL